MFSCWSNKGNQISILKVQFSVNFLVTRKKTKFSAEKTGKNNIAGHCKIRENPGKRVEKPKTPQFSSEKYLCQKKHPGFSEPLW